MTEDKKSCTNREILDEFLHLIVHDCYDQSPDTVAALRDEASYEETYHLRDWLIQLEIGVAAGIFSIIDGARGPSGWPGIKLVNAETGESLAEELQWELSRVESSFVGTETDPPEKPT